MILEAVRAGFEAAALLAAASAEQELDRILGAARETGAEIPVDRVFRTTDKLFAGASGTETPQGLAALFRPREWSFEDVLRSSDETNLASPLVAVMAGVQDPGNVGTIVRSAEAFGATGVIATRGTADPWSPKAIRSSAGSAIRIPLLRGMALAVVMAQLRIAGVKIAAATSDEAGTDLGDADLRGPVAIFIGNEGHGLPSEILRAADAKIAIAIRDSVESLNAGVAASVALYEAARQRANTQS
jgi:TrmH family RNA methyltransferase